MNPTSDREIVIIRTLNAPRSLVWKAWTEPERLVLWWGPQGFTNTFQEISVKTDGTWKFMMHGPDGVDYPNVIIFTEITEPERISFRHGGGEGEEEFLTFVTFEDLGDKTKLTMRSVFPTAEERDRVVREVGAIEGGNQTIDKLAAYVATM